MRPVLYIVVPCYNEKEVLPITSKQFEDKIRSLIKKRKITSKSRVLFVNDGSKDETWDIIRDL
ncbi:MAG: glycosyltransferase, partial [Lachnospiraceae bacterium]|nr:glycosyltransferase [Lachnospiraceae bacterium]